MIVVGDTTLSEIQPKLEKLFAKWKAQDVPQKNIADVTPSDSERVYILDRPDAEQTLIIVRPSFPRLTTRTK
jgi:zinc protease